MEISLDDVDKTGEEIIIRFDSDKLSLSMVLTKVEAQELVAVIVSGILKLIEGPKK